MGRGAESKEAPPASADGALARRDRARYQVAGASVVEVGAGAAAAAFFAARVAAAFFAASERLPFAFFGAAAFFGAVAFFGAAAFRAAGFFAAVARFGVAALRAAGFFVAARFGVAAFFAAGFRAVAARFAGAAFLAAGLRAVAVRFAGAAFFAAGLRAAAVRFAGAAFFAAGLAGGGRALRGRRLLRGGLRAACRAGLAGRGGAARGAGHRHRLGARGARLGGVGHLIVSGRVAFSVRWPGKGGGIVAGARIPSRVPDPPMPSVPRSRRRMARIVARGHAGPFSRRMRRCGVRRADAPCPTKLRSMDRPLLHARRLIWRRDIRRESRQAARVHHAIGTTRVHVKQNRIAMHAARSLRAACRNADNSDERIVARGGVVACRALPGQSPRADRHDQPRAPIGTTGRCSGPV
jgi:hypothetical protein